MQSIMVPDKFNMVDMGGIDLIMMQGEEVPGLYNRLVESIAQCRYQCLYNWFFNGVLIPSSYVEMEVNEDEEVAINEGVTVTPDDVIHIYSIAPGPVDPEIIPLLAEENGVYTAPAGKDGFNPVTVDVPSYTPVIVSKTITENGTYNVPSGVDGYSPVIVDVSGGGGGELTPLATDLATGYIGSGNWYSYQLNYADCRSDLYSVKAGETYLIALGGIVSTRFRVMFTTTDIRTIPVGSQQTISGVNISNADNPNPYDSTSYHATYNGFIIVGKSNNNTDNIEVRVIPAGFVA